jgi:hypothetical protein
MRVAGSPTSAVGGVSARVWLLCSARPLATSRWLVAREAFGGERSPGLTRSAHALTARFASVAPVYASVASTPSSASEISARGKRFRTREPPCAPPRSPFVAGVLCRTAGRRAANSGPVCIGTEQDLPVIAGALLSATNASLGRRGRAIAFVWSPTPERTSPMPRYESLARAAVHTRAPWTPTGCESTECRVVVTEARLKALPRRFIVGQVTNSPAARSFQLLARDCPCGQPTAGSIPTTFGTLGPP